MQLDAMILFFWMLNFKPTFSLSCFTFIKRLFSSSSLSLIRVVSSAYLRLLIFLPAVLIPACASSSLVFLVMYSAYKLAWAATILRIDCKEMGTTAPWNWRWTVAKTTNMMLVRPLMTKLNMSVRDECAVSACNPSPVSVYKMLSPPALDRCQPLDWCLPPSPYPAVAGIWNKAKFPFYQPGLLIGFWAASSQTPHTCSFGNNVTHHFNTYFLLYIFC